VLLAEDDPLIRSATRRTLEAAGFAVLEAEGGDEATEIARSGAFRIDLLLTDVGMPDRDGVEVSRALRDRDPGVPVVFMSGYPDEDLRVRGLDENATVLRKPFGGVELLRIVRRALGGDGDDPPSRTGPNVLMAM
jgi:DNA-binding response OmpR family regulator